MGFYQLQKLEESRIKNNTKQSQAIKIIATRASKASKWRSQEKQRKSNHIKLIEQKYSGIVKFKIHQRLNCSIDRGKRKPKENDSYESTMSKIKPAEEFKSSALTNDSLMVSFLEVPNTSNY